jgi:hypothetical protein
VQQVIYERDKMKLEVMDFKVEFTVGGVAISSRTTSISRTKGS